MFDRVIIPVKYHTIHLLAQYRNDIIMLTLDVLFLRRVLLAGAPHIPTAEALLGPVVVAMTNTVGRTELLTWLKSFLPQIPAGEVRPISSVHTAVNSCVPTERPRCVVS